MTTIPPDPNLEQKTSPSALVPDPKDTRKTRVIAWWFPVVSLLLFHLTNPLTWGQPLPGWWFPPAGLGLVLVAWLGPQVVLLFAADLLLVALQAQFMGTPVIWGSGWPVLFGAGWDALMVAGEVLLAWECYHRLFRGARHLGDPRSATLFLIIVPSVITGMFAGLRTLPLWLLPPLQPAELAAQFSGYWLSHALGTMVVAPPLLATLTPGLVRRRLARPQLPLTPHDIELPPPLSWSERIEIGGLALGLAILGLLQAFIHQDEKIDDWQLWGIPLLIIVGVSQRQGQRGGTIVASSAAGLQLILFGFGLRHVPLDSFWQGNLLAQCGTALLVAAAAHWIRQSEARYRQVVSRIPVMLYSARVTELPPDGRTPPRAVLTFVSPAARSLIDTDPEKLLGDNSRWLVLVHAEDQEVLRAALVQLRQQQQPVTCEYRLAPPDHPDCAPPSPSVPDLRVTLDSLQTTLSPTSPGSPVVAAAPPSTRQRWLRDTLAPQFGLNGDLQGWDGVISDITVQRALSDDLRRTTSMFHTLVANLPAGVFFVQGTAGRPILVNARARQLLGQLEDPSAGLDRLVEVYHLCRPDGTPYPTEELPVVGALRHGLTSMRDDIMVHRPDGQMMPLITWAAPVDLGSRDGGAAAVWVFEDLTALRRAEMELQRAQRLEVIGRLSSGIAHDFNNLLTVVLTLAQVIQDTLPPDHSAQQDLRRIAYAGEQAANLANQLLAFSKNRPAIPRRLDVNRVARRTLELLQATLPRLIKIESELADGELIVEADEMQLQQVLMNLCLNARDAMPKGGRLRVRTLKCSAADEVCLSVEDNGEGIPEDLQQRIFDPFFTTRERGTGLGLAMVRQIVERAGGRVMVWSRPGEGSRFDVSLPARA